MEHLTICLLLFLMYSSGVRGIELPAEKQVVTVENGTEPYVVLDCPYTLTEDDKGSMVLKWFLNNSDIQAYQWIPNGQINTSQTTIPEDVLEKTYQHSDDPNHKYRALKLLNPTTKQSGDYTCEISSHYDEKRLHISLIVYVLPDEMMLSVEELPDGNISIVCISQPTYPEPFVRLYVEVYEEREAIHADRETVYDDNTYNTTLSVELPPEKLVPYGDVNIVCKMTIPNSNISLEESFHLGPEVEEEVVVVADASTHKAVAVHGLSTALTPHPLLPLLAVVWIWSLRSSSERSL